MDWCPFQGRGAGSIPVPLMLRRLGIGPRRLVSHFTQTQPCLYHLQPIYPFFFFFFMTFSPFQHGTITFGENEIQTQ